MTVAGPLVALALFACRERGSGGGPPEGPPGPDVTWPDAPTTAFSSEVGFVPSFTASGEALVWVVPSGFGVDAVGTLYRLDLRTGAVDTLADAVHPTTPGASDDAGTVVFLRPGASAFDPDRLFVWSDGSEVELGAAYGVAWGVAAAGDTVWFELDGEVSAWTSEGGVAPLGAGDLVGGLPAGVLGWHEPAAQRLHLSIDGRPLVYDGVPTGAVSVGWTGAIGFEADGVFVAWPDAPTPVQILAPADYVQVVAVTLSDDGATVAVQGDRLGEFGVLWTYTRGEGGAVAALTEVAAIVLPGGGQVLAHGYDGALSRVSGGSVVLVRRDVCQWVTDRGRVAWIAGDCVDTGTAEVLGPTGAVSAPFVARLGPLGAGPDGVVVVDGTPGLPGTAWLLDAGRDPQALVDDVIGAGATDWGWTALREHPDGALSVLGADWETAPGELSWAEFGAWHLAAVVQRGDQYELDVVNLTR